MPSPGTLGGCFARFFRQPGHLKTITRATYGLEVAGTLRIGFDFLTDAAHIHIHRPRGHEAGIAPDGIQQVIATEDPARMPGKIVQQTKFGRRGGGQLSRTFNCIALASITTSSKEMIEGAVGRSKRRSTAFTLATSSRVAKGLVM